MKNLKALLFAVLLFALAGSVNAQSVGINSDGSTPAASAMLDVSSTAKELFDASHHVYTNNSYFITGGRISNTFERISKT